MKSHQIKAPISGDFIHVMLKKVNLSEKQLIHILL